MHGILIFLLGLVFHLPSFLLGVDTTSDAPVSYPYTVLTSQQLSSDVKRDDEEDCKKFHFGTMQNVKIPAHVSNHTAYKNKNVTLINKDNKTDPTFKGTEGESYHDNRGVKDIVELHHTTMTSGEYSWNKRDVLMHVLYVSDPASTVSVYEPGRDGGCKKEGSTERLSVQETARNRKCVAAINAGFFNVTSGKCLGNIISDRRLVQDSEGIQNAHFGITRDGNLFFGYLSEIDVIAEDFTQLVGGVIWVLRDGQIHVDGSIASECQDTETTGTLRSFADVISARTLVGHDATGRLVIVQIEGKTGRTGASLYDAAQFMKDLGVVNAINLDGGGSSSLVVNDTLLNYASDFCEDNKSFQCARDVTTILCVHEPYCTSPNCSGHGSCVSGMCHCHGNWAGHECNHLQCPNSCSSNGICREDGCFCIPGFYGDWCQYHCSDGWYGYQCQQKCVCQNNGTCDRSNGECQCLPGYTGALCQLGCSYGYYGDGCTSQCDCDDGCLCHPVTGSCNLTDIGQELLQAGTCIAKKLVKQEKLEDDMITEYRKAMASIIVISVFASLSAIVNLCLIWKYCTKWKHKTDDVKYRKVQGRGNVHTFFFQQFGNSSFTTSTSSEEEMDFTRIAKRKKKKKKKVEPS